MSSDQQRLSAFQAAQDEPEDEDTDDQPSAVDWTPSADGETRNSCENCGAYVSPDFVRVFGSNDGKVYGCYECEDRTAVREGGVAARGGL